MLIGSYKDGTLEHKDLADIAKYWQNDSVAFLSELG